jgi:type I restriction enzyme S subunit
VSAPRRRTWDEVQLGEMVTLRRGYDLPNAVRRTGPIPVVSSSGITGHHDEAKVQPPGVVTGRYGTLGEVFFVDEPFWPLNTTLYADDFHGNDERFIAYFLRAQGLGVHNGAAAVPGLNRNHLHQLPAIRPPVRTQRKIATILSAYDHLIDNNSRRIKILEEMAERIYREWFVEFRYPGHQSVPKIDSTLGPIPRGWNAMAVSEAIFIDPKTPVPKGVVVPFVPMMSVSENTMHIWPIEARGSMSGARFVNGDTLFARITPCLENGKTAYVQCLEAGQTAVGSTEFIVLRPRRLSAEAVYLLARSDGFRQHAIKSMSGATGRQRVRKEAFDSYFVAVPDADLLSVFGGIIKPMFDESYRLSSASQSLYVTRDLLLPRLVSGEIDLDELDIVTEELAL